MGMHMIEQQAWTASAKLSHRPRAAAPAPDVDLVERVAAGDGLAMRVLYARHHVRVFRFLLGIVKDRAAAEDLISEVFLELWRQPARFEARCALSTWLLSIARHKALSALRTRRVHAPLDEAAHVADAAPGPEAIVSIEDRGASIRRCLGKLSQEHREIIDLAYYHQKSIEEIAHSVGIPVATVKTRMFHARRRLGTLLATAGIDREAI
jgi:RNA polymerase sigma-70 factor (ECF subfamily)